MLTSKKLLKGHWRRFYGNHEDAMEIVYAMGFSQQKALENLDSLSLQISEHIFKICALPEHASINHWKNELKAWRRALTRYSVSKKKKPNFNKATLQKYLYNEPLGLDKDLSLLKKMVEDDYLITLSLPEDFRTKLEAKMCTYIESILENNDKWF